MIGKKIGMVFLIALSLMSCSKEGRFLYVPKQKPMAPRVACDCPEGFQPTPDSYQCVRESVAQPLSELNPTPIRIGDNNWSYASLPACLADTSTNTEWPFVVSVNPYSEGSATTLQDGANRTLPIAGFNNEFWRERVIGESRVGIKGTETNVWHTKTFCFQNDVSKQYVIHIGADNKWQVNIDGLPYGRCASSWCHLSSVFMGHNLSAGKHLVELKYLDEGSFGSVWFEVFDNTFDEIRNVQSESELRTLYSSRSLLGENWDYTGEICPVGFSYDVCGQNRKCTKIEHQACR